MLVQCMLEIWKDREGIYFVFIKNTKFLINFGQLNGIIQFFFCFINYRRYLIIDLYDFWIFSLDRQQNTQTILF